MELKTIPEECITKLKQSFQNLLQLTLEVDSIALAYGFKVKKSNGDKAYIYLSCSKSGNPPPEKSDKQRNRVSEKTSKSFFNILLFTDCPFKITYKWNNVAKQYEFHSKKANLQHNHLLDIKSLTKKQKEDILSYMQLKELEEHSTPKILCGKGEAYPQGKEKDLSIKVNVSQGSYLLSKAKQKIWGPAFY